MLSQDASYRSINCVRNAEVVSSILIRSTIANASRFNHLEAFLYFYNESIINRFQVGVIR